MNHKKLLKILPIVITIIFLASILINSESTLMTVTESPKAPVTGMPHKPINIISATVDHPQWWNKSWHYRTFVNVSFPYSSDVNVTIYLEINFTRELESINLEGEVDPNSIRVVEYDPATGAVLGEMPSRFIQYSGWNATTNATGAVLFVVKAPITANVNRTFAIYFDTTEFGTKTSPTYTSSFEGFWEQFYDITSGSYSSADSVPYHSPPNLERNSSDISYNDDPSGTNTGSNAFPDGADSDSDWEYFGGNWTTWLYIDTPGVYNFKISSDDGSWMFINDSQIINNGGNHGETAKSTSIYLKEGIYKLGVKWYENGGRAAIYAYWTKPGGSEQLINTQIYAFKNVVFMDYSNLPQRVIVSTEAAYILDLYVKDKGNVPVEGTQVLLYKTDDTDQLMANKTTDENGHVTLFHTDIGNYTVVVKNKTTYPEGSSNKIWVSKNISYEVTTTSYGDRDTETVILPLSTLVLQIRDRNGIPIKYTSDEVLRVKLWNSTYGDLTEPYVVDSNGNVTFYRVPSGQYKLKFQYTNFKTGLIYTYDQITSVDLNAYSSVSSNVEIGLVTFTVKVVSNDSEPVPSATVDLNHKDVQTSVSNTTEDNGIAQFYRVLDGTWTFDVYYTNIFGQTIHNNTEEFDVQPNTEYTIVLPMSTLIVRVNKTNEDKSIIAGANVTVYTSDGSSLVTSLQTNNTGYAVFQWLQCGSYIVNASYQGNPSDTDESITLYNQVYLKLNITITRYDKDIYLTPLSATTLTGSWNDNITLPVNFTYWDAAQSKELPLTGAYMNFTVYLGSTIVAFGDTKNNFIIENQTGNGVYYLYINTKQLGMYPSVASYTIYVMGNKTGYNALKQPLIYVITITAADTTLTPSANQISINWSESVVLTVLYTDSDHNLPISGASNRTYIIYNSERQEVLRGSLTESGIGTYLLDINTETNNIDVGTYTIYIILKKRGYVNQTISIPLEVNLVSTELHVSSNEITVTWGELFQIEANYTSLLKKAPVSGATVYFVITNTSTSYSMPYNATSTYFESNIFNSSDFVSGVYHIIVYAKAGNHVNRTQEIILRINPVPTRVEIINLQDTYNLTWGDNLELEIRYIDNRTDAVISSATVYATWPVIAHTDIFEYNATLQRYYVNIETSNLYTGEYNVSIIASLMNYTTVSVKIHVIINPVPIDVVHIHEAYIVWGDKLYINVHVKELVNETGVTDASVYVIWYGGMRYLPLISENGVYEHYLDTSVASPGTYNITLYVHKLNYEDYVYQIKLVILYPVEFSVTDLSGYWNTTLLIAVNVTNTYNDEAVVNGNLTLTIGDIVITLEDLGNNGTYFGELDLGLLNASDYVAVLQLNKTGFQNKTETYALHVLPIPTNLTIDFIKNIEQGSNNLTIIITYTDVLNNKTISGATVIITLLGKEYTAVEIGDGIYRVVIDVSNLTIDGSPYNFVVNASKLNYESAVLQDSFNIVEVTVTIPILGIKLTQSQLTFGITLALSSVAIFGSAIYAYRLHKIPAIIRNADKAIKMLSRGKIPNFEQFPTFEEVYNEMLGPYFEPIGTSPPSIKIEEGE
ncbi:MAG: SpaA isopeptide-forming pilin-related protein [Candidatus Asgardarchaeia archaeon]